MLRQRTHVLEVLFESATIDTNVVEVDCNEVV
jgi:hypothetical protein